MAHLSDYDIRKQYAAVVRKTERLTPQDTDEIREIQLEVQDGGFDCEVDQSFGVLLDFHDDFGNTKHHRLYSVADVPVKSNGKTSITMLVKRCYFVDDFSGELETGVASNYLCDREVGDEINITGPYELAFTIPEEKDANLILIGMGTGIAPFRAFIKHIHREEKGFTGKVLLFYGARSGLELLYLNEEKGDLVNYYDQETFEAVSALSPSPMMDEQAVLDLAIEERADEILTMLSEPKTYVYIAGHDKVKQNLEKAFIEIMGSDEKWKARKAELVAANKWIELIY